MKITNWKTEIGKHHPNHVSRLTSPMSGQKEIRWYGTHPLGGITAHTFNLNLTMWNIQTEGQPTELLVWPPHKCQCWERQKELFGTETNETELEYNITLGPRLAPGLDGERSHKEHYWDNCGKCEYVLWSTVQFPESNKVSCALLFRKYTLKYLGIRCFMSAINSQMF